MKLKAVIFDLDGTIADTLPLCIAAFRKSIEPLIGKALSDGEITGTFGPSEEGTIRKLAPQHEQQGIESYLNHYQELHYMCPVVFPGIKPLLDLLQARNISLAMVTGKGIHSTRLSLQQFGIEPYFEVLETGSPNGPNKVDGIRNVLKRLEVAAGESLYIGDAPSDIKYCKEAGVPIAAAAWGTTTNAAELLALQPDYIFYRIEEFRDWVIEVLDKEQQIKM